MGGVKDRVAIVTGGSRGIGQAIAELFAENGAKVIIWDLKSKKAKTTFTHGSGLKHFSLQAKAKRLLTTSDKGKVLLWDLSQSTKYLLSLAQDPNVKAEIDKLNVDKSVTSGNINRAAALIKQLEESTKTELESSEFKVYSTK